MALKLLFPLFCTIGLVLSESKGSEAAASSESRKGSSKSKSTESAEAGSVEQQCVACPKVTDYGPQITSLDSKLQGIVDDLDLPAVKGYGTAIGSVQAELAQLDAKLKTFQKEQVADQRVLKLEDSVQSLQSSLSAVEKARASTSADAASSSAAVKEQIASLQKQLDAELKAHGERVEAVAKLSADSTDNAPSTESVDALESKVAALSKKVGRFEKTHKEMRIKLKTLEKLIAEQNHKIRAVHESTIGAIASRWFEAALDGVANVGEATMEMVQSAVKRAQEIEWRQHFEHYSAKTVERATEIGQSVTAKVQEVDWKGYYEATVRAMGQYAQRVVDGVQAIDWEGYWRSLTDPGTYSHVVQWLQSIWAVVDDWWMNGAQPTIARQVTEVSVQVRVMTADAMESVHSHLLYREMVAQLMPYLEMAGVPVDYCGYIVDGLLVLFVISGMWVLTMVLGLLCDCCCPIKRIADAKPKEKAQPKGKGAKSVGNGIKGQQMKGNERKGKRRATH